MPEKNRFPAVLQSRLNWPADVSCSLNASFANKQGLEDQHVDSACPMFVPGVVAPTLTAANDPSRSPQSAEITAQVAAVVEALAFAQNQVGEVRTNNIANTLNTNSNASGRNTPLVAVSVDENLVLMDQGGSVMQTLQDGTVGTLRREMHGHEPIVLHAVGTDCYNGSITGDVAATMGTPGSSVNASGPTVMQSIPLDLRNAGRDPEKHDEMNRQGVGVGNPGDPAHTVTKACVHGVAVFHPTQDPIPSDDEKCHSIGCGSKTGCATAAVAYQDVAYHATRRDGVRINVGVSPTVEAQWGTGGNNVPNVMNKPPSMVVRRLTPEECESLQGFPRGWTNIPYKKKQDSPDSPRYKALGNSMACNCMAWIGERIDAAEKGVL